MRPLVLILLAGCAMRARTLPASHPASADAPTGRLAGAPPALRPGVVDYRDVPAPREAPPTDSGDHRHEH